MGSPGERGHLVRQVFWDTLGEQESMLTGQCHLLRAGLTWCDRIDRKPTLLKYKKRTLTIVIILLVNVR